MTTDPRAQSAKYYDLGAECEDLEFYRARIPSLEATVLELGCGTGRVLIPLANCCGFIHGLDISEAMLEICRERLQNVHLPAGRVQIERGDITRFDLGRTFDLIIAPYRVFQNLETDEQVDGLFRCVRKHLSPGGSCILNVFKPLRSPEELRRHWSDNGEDFSWEKVVEGRRVQCYCRRSGIDAEHMVIYPWMTYRTYEGEALKETAVLRIAMKCYWPEQFEKLILDHGFAITNRWGGYAGEPYGQGSELVVQFVHGE